jgi:general secretion pathway protein L
MITASLRDYWDWWSAEIQRLTPRSALTNDQPCVEINRGEAAISWPNGSRSEALAIDDLANALSQFPVCTLLIAEGRYVLRRMADSALPYSRAKDISAVDLIAQTPFRPDEVYFTPITSFDGSPSSYAVIKRTVLDPYVSALATAGIRIKTISLARSGDVVACIPRRALREIVPKSARGFHRSHLVAAALCASVLVIALTFGHAFFRYGSALSALDSDIAVKRQQAVSVRAALNQRAKTASALEIAHRRKVEEIPVTAVWEEISRRFPDGSWLTDLSIDRGILTISGFAQSAAGLIGPLEESALFSEPSFTSPIVRVPGQTGEHFEMRLKVVRE